MTPEQAHQILVDVTAKLQLTRQDHQTVAKALDILKPKKAKEKSQLAGATSFKV